MNSSDESDRGKGERRLGTVVADLMRRRGYASILADQQLDASIATVLGSNLKDAFAVGKLKRGVLMIYALDSVTMQEMTFAKRQLLRQLAKDHPHIKIEDLRFRVTTLT